MRTFIRKSAKKIQSKPAKKFVVKKPSAAMPLDITSVESKDEMVKEVKNPQIHERAAKTIDSLNILLDKPVSDSSPVLSEKSDSNAVYSEEKDVPDEFNGVSDLDEQKELYSEAIDYERKKKKVVEEQVRLLEIEHEKEKKAYEQEIRNLKNELHRTAPIQNNKFFSLSKELREAIADIEKIASLEGITVTRIPPKPSEPKEVPLPANAIPQIPYQAPTPTTPVAPSVAMAESVSPTSTSAPKEEKKSEVVKPADVTEKKILPKKKMMITGAVATVLLLVSGSIAANAMFKKPKVDQKIVDKYLSEQTNGQVQGATTGEAGGQNSGQQEVDPSQSTVSFEESLWAEFKDSQFGVLLQYPKNAVKAVRTDSNITFIRKTGYLFKIQRIETSLTPEEYWKQIKATSLNYTSKADKFKNKPALKLELEDMTDYPGDRYLIKEGDFIYDIWYATPSNNFAKDDIQRAEKMLASLSITGSKQ